MKINILILIFFCLQSTLSAQIRLDSMAVFGDTTNIDSVQFIGTSSDQEIDNITYVASNDACGSLYYTLTFKGCGPIHTTYFDTTIVLGVKTKRIVAYTEWDTLASCSVPMQKIRTDSAEWNYCGLTNIVSRDIIEGKISIYPTPAKHKLYLDNPNSLKIVNLYLTDMSGKIVRSFEACETTLDVSGLSKGNYLLQLISKERAFAKNVVLE